MNEFNKMHLFLSAVNHFNYERYSQR